MQTILKIHSQERRSGYEIVSHISKRRFRKKMHEISFSIFTEEDDYVDVLIISERIKR